MRDQAHEHEETGIVSYETGREHELDKRVGQRVRALRLRRGLGAAACAELCGRTPEWLRQVERGEQPLDKLSTVVLLARVLGVVNLDLIVGEKLGGLTFTLSQGGSADARSGSGRSSNPAGSNAPRRASIRPTG